MFLLERSTEDVPAVVFVDAQSWVEIGSNVVFYAPRGTGNPRIAHAVFTIPSSEVVTIDGSELPA